MYDIYDKSRYSFYDTVKLKDLIKGSIYYLYLTPVGYMGKTWADTNIIIGGCINYKLFSLVSISGMFTRVISTDEYYKLSDITFALYKEDREIVKIPLFEIPFITKTEFLMRDNNNALLQIMLAEKKKEIEQNYNNEDWGGIDIDNIFYYKIIPEIFSNIDRIDSRLESHKQFSFENELGIKILLNGEIIKGAG